LGSQIIINAMKNDLKEEGRKPQNSTSAGGKGKCKLLR
jgi:hypothetical protein